MTQACSVGKTETYRSREFLSFEEWEIGYSGFAVLFEREEGFSPGTSYCGPRGDLYRRGEVRTCLDSANFGRGTKKDGAVTAHKRNLCRAI